MLVRGHHHEFVPEWRMRFILVTLDDIVDLSAKPQVYAVFYLVQVIMSSWIHVFMYYNAIVSFAIFSHQNSIYFFGFLFKFIISRG